ncbi:hypothetical protein COCC4DRAFT_138095 [Bipolaris maydis ATCC 48331]|uniref:Uncharacterized protein n=2 Tax=Cochliobolus heterostrophus TaxID=5016 RepID=M2UN40_COCH5|nr:uncharacterized protein COCC4DRAFT_138095 [Bipolaris maydis ATCC 48331]EMD89327.1 hypothetical protein COCHEDRAFT_1107840 [Bipolaris maydis C5]ENI04956.1 hypothetical protein COCC4DRAFT_138095 [Bipolaris maydis ATCC 48331]KAJ6212678.1 hypothetical protein PSV09DRAFT_1107840 [Bipolaris maydis]
MPRDAVADRAMYHRIQTLFHNLLTIKSSLNARLHLHNLIQNSSFYCLTCSPSPSSTSNIPGTCGPSCALLRPPSSTGFIASSSSTAASNLDAIQSDFETYYDILKQIYRRGRDVTDAEAAGWERQVEEMRAWSETPTERWEREGWEVWRRRERWVRGFFGREWEGGGRKGDGGVEVGGC